MTVDLALDELEFNEFNPRLTYSESSVQNMVKSMSIYGQLAPVKVRARSKGKYEVVFGHRRVSAARKMGWTTIKAEIASLSDEQMIQEAIVENLERKDFSDFEKAVAFERLHAEFGKSYEEIATAVGLSKQSISNHVAMLRLFDRSYLEKNPEIRSLLERISERHARVISRAQDFQTKANLVHKVVDEELSVRDLENVFFHLRSWFNEADPLNSELEILPGAQTGKLREETAIKELIRETLLLAQREDFLGLDKTYLFDEGCTIFPALRGDLAYRGKASSYKHLWSRKIASRMDWKIEELDVRMLSSTSALALARVQYSDRVRHFSLRGTINLVSRKSGWKIIHEHWSTLETESILEEASQPSNRRLR